MKSMTLLKQLMRMNQTQIHNTLIKFLQRYYQPQNIINTKDYILVTGEIPIVLVAHLDTVHKMLPQEFFYDSEKNVLWSPQGLGADDRAGVYAILQIISSGLRPHVIFCHDEETGGIGAKALVTDIPYCPFDDLKCIIELDRSGKQDCVFYDCNNEDFNKYIESFGFVYDEGSFSDISIIAPKWEIAAVNLSIGYYHEHSLGEYLNIKEMNDTIEKVKAILQKADSMQNYGYITKVYTNFFDDVCLCCGKRTMKGAGFNIFNGIHYVTICTPCYAAYFMQEEHF